MDYRPFVLMEDRVDSAKNESDISFFYDLLLFGELMTKIITVGLVSALNDDNNRTRFRFEHRLVRANAVGEFAQTIVELLTGPPSQILNSALRDYEQKELTQRVKVGAWQYEALKNIVKCLDIFEIEHNELPTKAPLRLWFQYFTQLRNKTKGHGAPRVQACSKSCPLLKKSIYTIVNNFTLFKRPWVYLYQNLSGKYRVSYISKETNDFDHLKSNVGHNHKNGIYCFFDKPRKVNLIYSNPELTDYYLVNGNFKNDGFETISYITDEKKQKKGSNYNQPITNLPASHTSGKPKLEVIGETFTNLPNVTDDYVNRLNLEKELKDVLSLESRYPVITLLGRGGIGKTSLAIKVLHEISESKRFDLILWFSARDIDLLQEGPKPVQTMVLNKNDISKSYCSLIYPNEDCKDHINFFSKQLEKNEFGNALYVFDNFETVTNPIELFNWLNTHIRNPNKILITSRISRNFKGDYPIEVSGMSEQECKNLIKKTAIKFGIDSLINERYVNELINESNGHPYIIKILMGEVAKSKKLGNVKRIVSDQDNILTALFQRTYSSLSQAAKRIFLTLCSWNSDIPKIALEAVIWRPENEKIDIEKSLEELRKSSFIEMINEGSESVITVPLAASLFGQDELEVSPQKLQILEDRKLLMEFGVLNNIAVGKGVADRIEKKFREVSKRINNYEDLKPELPILKYLASKFPKAWLFLARIFEEFDKLEETKDAYRAFLKNSIPPAEKAKYWLKLADLCKSTNDWEGESHALSELALTPDVPFQSISNAANRINYYFYHHPEAKDKDYKKQLLKSVIKVMENRIREASSTDLSRLAWLLLNNKNDEKAKMYIEKGLKKDPSNEHCLKLYEKIKS